MHFILRAHIKEMHDEATVEILLGEAMLQALEISNQVR